MGVVKRHQRSEDTDALGQVVKDCGHRTHLEKATLALPPSINSAEYSDCLGGALVSGSVVPHVEIMYLKVHAATDDGE